MADLEGDQKDSKEASPDDDKEAKSPTDDAAISKSEDDVAVAVTSSSPMNVAEDRTAVTEHDDDDDGDFEIDDETTLEEETMPLLNYSRLSGAGLPRVAPTTTTTTDGGNSYFQPPCSCSELTVIRVDPEDLPQVTDVTALTTRAAGTDAASSLAQQVEQQQLLSSDLWQQPHVLMACAWEGRNTITLTNVPTSATPGPSRPVVIVGSSNSNADGSSTPAFTSIQLLMRDTESAYSVVDMSFDASGTVLGAVDDGGTCTIWEFKYTTTLQPNRLLYQTPVQFSPSSNATQPQTVTPTASADSTAGARAGNNNMFSNWMSTLTGMPPSQQQQQQQQQQQNSSHDGATTTTTDEQLAESSLEGMSAALTAKFLSQPSRINYPSNWGAPTCMVLEPSYKRKREKSLLVGFANGRLVQTKRGTFFSRRNDTILYQAGHSSKDHDSQYRGIESVVWRGSLVAWADANGIKLLDMEHLTRIAHIDRPTGARPSLYPTVRDLQPSLFFETSNHLLVAWGDCLMQMQIDEHIIEQDASGGSSSEGKKRQTVQCTMAWELDCVACDVVPLDANHVVVLGLVPVLQGDNEGESKSENGTSSSNKNDVELQIVSRNDGTVRYCDALPLLKSPPFLGLDSAQALRLLSSFALSRMEDSEETKVLKSLPGYKNDMGVMGIDVDFNMNQNLFSGTDTGSKKKIEYRDAHLMWSVDSILENDLDVGYNPHGSNDAEDTGSVDSDDYEFVLQPIEIFDPWSTQGATSGKISLAPIMVVCSASDAVLTIVSNLDDAIDHAVARHKCAHALKLALQHRRQLRRHGIDEISSRYLESLLRIHASSGEDDRSEQPSSMPLSLRRTQLAVKAMPILLGDKIELWERWSRELGNVPGALFMLRNYLPVRDPILPTLVYEHCLNRMLFETENLTESAKNDHQATMNINGEAAKQFLESLAAWGPTKVLKEYIRLYKWSRERRKGDKTISEDLKGAEVALQRRYMQTAAVYMKFPVTEVAYEVSAPKYDAQKDDTQDSLFDVGRIVCLIAPRAPLVLTPDETAESEQLDQTHIAHMLAPNSHVSLEAMARLRMMQGRYDLVLKCFLAIGACHSSKSLESFEKQAIDTVHGLPTEFNGETMRIGSFSYDFVIDLIERHHLNQFLLQKDFVLSTDSRLFSPLLALLRLVGLHCFGDFLIQHCVSPDYSYHTTASKSKAKKSPKMSGDNSPDTLRREPLPIDKVAEQLESSPAILHWYLHLVFTKRPELYVKFPNNAVPPKEVTALHRKHFQLYVDLAGELGDSRKALARTEKYNAEAMTTPLLSFLKASLPLGGLLPIDARRVLEIRRSNASDSDEENEGDKSSDASTSSSPLFAVELAYVIETYSKQTEKEAIGILNLYLMGAKSLMLSVLYAQRQMLHSSMLWDRLLSYCTSATTDGVLFGELLEAAAHSGADLSRLVGRIPQGMDVEGLRPRLVAAVADYRMKLEIYEAATEAGAEEEICLMREIAQRSRRGVRYFLGSHLKTFAELIQEKNLEAQGAIGEKIIEDIPTTLPKELKIKLRQTHHRLAYSVPRR